MPQQVRELDIEDALMLHQWAGVFDARQSYAQLSLNDYPNMKAEPRRKLHKGLYKAAYPTIMGEEPRALTLEDLARMGNG